MKKIVLLASVILLTAFVFVSQTQSKTQTYYSGDAISFNNQVYVASTNMGSLEVFKLENSELNILARVKALDARFGRYDKFYSAKFSEENGKLFVYAVSGFNLYKYEVNGSQLKEIANIKNSSWEWYTRVDKFDDNIVTVSDKGVKIWDAKIMDVIDAYSFTNKQNPYNIGSNNGQYIFNVQDNYLFVYDRETRSTSAKIALNYKNVTENHQVYQDQNGSLYVADDYFFKKFDISGRLVGNFKHVDYQGYDASASGNSNYVYFSNGLGVVKLNKDTMELVDSQDTSDLAGTRGWAMGIKAVYANGDKLVVFNNANILVLDENLNKLAGYKAIDEAELAPSESLYLNLSHNSAAPSTSVELSGGGYLPNEVLKINFAGVDMRGQTDSRGRFDQVLTVPAVKDGRVDIKVDGETSGLTYSIDFTIAK
jgi:hypothetical protein